MWKSADVHFFQESILVAEGYVLFLEPRYLVVKRGGGPLFVVFRFVVFNIVALTTEGRCYLKPHNFFQRVHLSFRI